MIGGTVIEAKHTMAILGWLNRRRIYWKLSFRYWRAKRRVARGSWL